VEITLEGTTPPISDTLSIFLTTTGPQGQHFPGPFVGFRGADRGQGPGNGVDEDVPFSFTFPRFKKITQARLGLTLTPGDALVNTDALNFAQVGLDFAYGRAELANLKVGTTTIIVFDLGNIDEIETVNERSTGNRDLRNFLLGGHLDVVYADDAIIQSAFLSIEGIPAEPVLELPSSGGDPNARPMGN
jgi:hypothetical protein